VKRKARAFRSPNRSSQKSKDSQSPKNKTLDENDKKEAEIN